MKRVPLNPSGVALVDDADFALVSQFTWWNDTGYAATRVNRRKVYMHRLLLGNDSAFLVDHVNRNKLDNRRKNLRLATKQDNAHNSALPRHNTSGIRGVCWSRKQRRWLVRMCLGDSKPHHFGSFTNKNEAQQLRAEIEFAYWLQRGENAEKTNVGEAALRMVQQGNEGALEEKPHVYRCDASSDAANSGQNLRQM